MKNKIIPVIVFTAVFWALGLSVSVAEDSEKLDLLLENQVQILAKLDEIKSELAVVKIRATER